jgi:ribokinase
MKDDETDIDVLGLGAVAVDDLIYVESYPPPDRKVPVLRRERQCGGLTATALVAAARLGARCSYAGVLGSDELSEFVVRALKQEAVDVSHLVRQEAARPVHSTIIVDEGQNTRNIFFDLHGVVGAHDELPAAKTVRKAKVLFVDHLGIKGMARASEIAREAGIPVVADLESNESPHFARLLGLVDHLILSHGFATRLTGEAEPGVAVEKLWSQNRKVVIVTCGAEGCWYLGELHREFPTHQTAFPVETVDTTGCGDVFHGAYAWGLAKGLDLPERVRFASATAALKATRPGGQQGIPSRKVVEGFLRGERCNDN